ncbi:hypothetical protein FOPE_04882 [Fonsecaea pedrosoi]|nr:hypothetical protein FOPE_04882 [Fonsecaea pedrosoi]
MSSSPSLASMRGSILQLLFRRWSSISRGWTFGLRETRDTGLCFIEAAGHPIHQVNNGKPGPSGKRARVCTMSSLVVPSWQTDIELDQPTKTPLKSASYTDQTLHLDRQWP